MNSKWQAYVDKNLIGAGVASKACIIGDDEEIYAAGPPGFSVLRNEIKDIFKGFDDPSLPLAAGLFIQATKYMTLRSDGELIVAKNGAEAALVAKTKRAAVVAVADLDKVDVREAERIVQDLQDHLMDGGV